MQRGLEVGQVSRPAHEKLTYRYLGRDFRLTDVAGKVVEPILA